MRWYQSEEGESVIHRKLTSQTVILPVCLARKGGTSRDVWWTPTYRVSRVHRCVTLRCHRVHWLVGGRWWLGVELTTHWHHQESLCHKVWSKPSQFVILVPDINHCVLLLYFQNDNSSSNFGTHDRFQRTFNPCVKHLYIEINETGSDFVKNGWFRHAENN